MAYGRPCQYGVGASFVAAGEENEGASEGGGVRWDLVASGICATVILLAIVTLIGVATYAYRHKHKQRQRR